MDDIGTTYIQLVVKFCDLSFSYLSWNVQTLAVTVLPCEPTDFIFDPLDFEDIHCIIGIDCN